MVFYFLGSFGRRWPHSPKSTLKSINCQYLGLTFFFHRQIAIPFAVQDEFEKKNQDLNPECKEVSSPIMELGVKLEL